MAVAAGTTSRQLGWLGQAALLAVLLLAPLTLWWPSLAGWSTLLGASLALGTFWLCWRTVSQRRHLVGNWIHVALVINLVLSASHAVVGGWRATDDDVSALGRTDISLMLQWAVLALLVLLIQDFLCERRPAASILSVLGLAQAAGALVALWTLDWPTGKLPPAMMGWAGVGLWLAGRCWLEDSEPPLAAGRPFVDSRIGPLVAMLLAAILAWLYPAGLILATGAAGTVFLLAGLLQPGSRVVRLSGGAALLVLAGWTGLRTNWPVLPAVPVGLAGWLGQGDIALARLGNWPAGLTVLAAINGWAGVLALAAAMLASAIAALYFTRPRPLSDQSAAILLVFAAACAAAALLCPGGLFNPAGNVVFALSWALLPAAYGGPRRRRSGLWLAGLALGLSVLLGLARHDGLLYWSAAVYGLNDWALHLTLGWLTTQMLLWWLGRRWLGGVLAVLIGLAASGLGEWAQRSFTTYRLAEWRDFGGHALGALGAVVLYILCKTSQAGESVDVRAQAE